jgi:hypothetical protein
MPKLNLHYRIYMLAMLSITLSLHSMENKDNNKFELSRSGTFENNKKTNASHTMIYSVDREQHSLFHEGSNRDLFNCPYSCCQVPHNNEQPVIYAHHNEFSAKTEAELLLSIVCNKLSSELPLHPTSNTDDTETFY